MTQPMSIPSKRLAASITATATSLRINNINDWSGSAMTGTSFASSTSWPAVLRNDANTQIEFVELDMTTLSTSVFTADITKRGLGYAGGTTANTSTSYSWNTNDIVELGSNPPQLYEQYVDKDNAETIAGVKTFSSFPAKSGTTTPTSSSEFATKGYVDASVSSSLAYNAEVISGTAGAAMSLGSIVYFSSSDQKWYVADADLTTSFQNKTLGAAVSSGAIDTSINIMLSGRSSSVSTSMTAGTKYYLSNTAGGIATTGTYEVYLGYALSSTDFLFTPRADDMPYAYEKDALAGLAITATAPSATNTYLTAADSTSAVVTNLIPRRNTTGDIIVNVTPQSSDAAASKGYVDGLANINLVPSLILSTSRTYSVSQFIQSSGSVGGWTGAQGAFTFYNPYTKLSYSAGAAYGFGGNLGITFGDNKNINIGFPFNLTTGTISTGDYYAWGLFETLADTTNVLSTSIANIMARFIYDYQTSSFYAASATTSTYTATQLSTTNYPPNTRMFYQINIDPGTSIAYYINGTLVATHTTAIPTSTSPTDAINFGVYAITSGAVAQNKICYLHNGLIAYEL